MIKVGDTIIYKRNEVAATGVVVAIDKCLLRGGKYGEKVQQLDWADRDYGFFKLDSGEYCYGSELVK